MEGGRGVIPRLIPPLLGVSPGRRLRLPERLVKVLPLLALQGLDPLQRAEQAWLMGLRQRLMQPALLLLVQRLHPF